MRKEKAAARARLLPSTAALVSSAEVTVFLDGYLEEQSPFSTVGLWLQRKRLGLYMMLL